MVKLLGHNVEYPNYGMACNQKYIISRSILHHDIKKKGNYGVCHHTDKNEKNSISNVGFIKSI